MHHSLFGLLLLKYIFKILAQVLKYVPNVISDKVERIWWSFNERWTARVEDNVINDW